MSRNKVLGMVFFTLLAVVCPLRAGQAEEAMTLVDSAMVMFQQAGREAALKAINEKSGPFVKGDLYVFALTMDNLMVGHPHEHSLRRVNLNNTRDANGVLLFQKFKEVVEKKGSGWVEYTWAKPGEKDPSPKRSFVKKVPGEDLYIGAGYYVPTGVVTRADSGQ